MNALRAWGIRSSDIKNASTQAGGFQREELLRAREARDPSGANRFWKLHAPAYGLNDAPAALRDTLRRYLPRAADLSARADIEFLVSTFDPRKYFVLRGSGVAVGTLTTHTDDVPGCGEPDILLEERKYLGRRFGDSDAQEQYFAHVGVDLPEANDFSIQSAQETSPQCAQMHSNNSGIAGVPPTP